MNFWNSFLGKWFKINKLFLLLFLLISLGGCKEDRTVNINPIPDDSEETEESITQKFSDADWEIENVSDAFTWRYNLFSELYSSNQSITVLDVDLNQHIEVDIPYVTSGFLKTSAAATDANAIAAINGSYFNTSDGGATVFFKKDGSIINHTYEGFDPYRENSAFTISGTGEISIVKRPTSGWETVEVENVLASGPLLVYAGEVVNQQEVAFNTDRHPRTAVCTTENNHLLAVVVDGRSSLAHGMRTEELALVMKVLGCARAMNMDGGGSSTAWVKNQGVVNYPSDNDQFDHEGERGVATVITFGVTNN